MDRPSLIFIVMPIVILIALFTGIALPFIAASRSGRSHARGQPARADELKRIRAARRKARPPEPGADNAAPAGYLYVPCARVRYHGDPAGTRRWVQEVPIVKKTAKVDLLHQRQPGPERGRCQPRPHQPGRVRDRHPVPR